MSDRIYESSSVADTERVAGEVAARLASGGVVALEGDLGAGKTQFVRGLVRALGGDARQVHSPTFVLLHEYALANGRRLFHLDAYRVAGPADFDAIGFDELLSAVEAGDVMAVEWPSRVAELIPPSAVRVTLVAESRTYRRVHVDSGPRMDTDAHG